MNSLPEAFAEVGVRLPLLVTGWLAVALFVVALIFVALEYRFELDELGFVFAFGAAACAVVSAVVWVILLIPFDGKYHHYYEVSGHVDSVSNVLSEADGELTRQPVISLDSLDRPLVVDDPRAVSLKDSDVVLRCTVGWNYQAADSYSCRIVAFDSAVAR